MELQIYYHENLLSLRIIPFTKILYYKNWEPYGMYFWLVASYTGIAIRESNLCTQPHSWLGVDVQALIQA